MRQQKPSKPRTTTITMDMGRPVQITRLSVSSEGSFEFFDEDGKSLQPEQTILERGYERAKGPKVLSRAPVNSVAPISSDPNKVLQNYDTIFALDTNTKQIRGDNVSVAALVLGKWAERAPTWRLAVAPTHALEFHNVDCHPDLLALKHVIQQMERDPCRSNAGRVAFVIDSHLGNIAKIVAREIPILDDCYFPEWADLIYASDAARDSVANILLQASDRASDDLLRQIEAGQSHSTPRVEDPEHSSHFHVWKVRGSSK